MMARRGVRVFANPRSGPGDCTPDVLARGFREQGCPCEVILLTADVDLPGLAVTDDAATVWIAAGGDGTVNAIVNAIVNAKAGSGRTMGVLPAGTLNHFAHDLGVPGELAAAIRLAATGTPQAIDAAEVNGQIFVNNSSLGFYPAMVADRERMKKTGANKWMALAAASLKALVRFPCVTIELTVDGEVRHRRTALLFIGNNAYTMEPGGLGSRQSLNKGRLSVCIVPGKSRWSMLRLLAATLAGKARQAKDLECFEVEALTVRSRKKQLRVAFDGEIRRMRTPLCYVARPHALQVIAPEPAPR